MRHIGLTTPLEPVVEKPKRRGKVAEKVENQATDQEETENEEPENGES